MTRTHTRIGSLAVSASLLLVATTGTALLAAPAVAAPAPAGAASADAPLLRQGSTGQAVRDWQRVLQRLVAEEVLDLPRVVLDGQFGPQTRAATVAVQRLSGASVDGVVGPRTRAGAGTLLSAGPSGPQEPQGVRNLRQGDRGPDVRQWQETLERARRAGEIDVPRVALDGVFGPATRQATVAAQRRLGVTRDGIVGPVTFGGLGSLLGG